MTPLAEHAPDHGVGVRELVTVAFKHNRLIVLTTLSVVAMVTAATLLIPPTYEAESKLLVRYGRENIYRSEIGEDRSEIVALNTEEILNSEVSILTSRDVIRQVVETIGVKTLYPRLAGRGTPERQLDNAIERFAKDLRVDAVRKSSVLEISLTHGNPTVAANALNLLVERFKDKHIQAYSDSKSSYLESQLNDYHDRLSQSQLRLEAYKQEHGVFALAEQRTLLLQQRSELEIQFKTTTSRIRELQQNIASLHDQLTRVDTEVALSTEDERYRAIDEAKSELLKLQLREQDLLRIYTDKNQLVVAARREIGIVNDFIARQEAEIGTRMRTGQNVVHQDLQKDLLRLQAELPAQQARGKSLSSQLAQLDVQIPTLDGSEDDLDNLQRELSTNDRNYRAYQERVEGSRILEDLNRQRSANISVIQNAIAPVAPVRPRPALNISLAALLGALAGLSVAFATEMLSQGLSTPERAERRLGLPVLATISLRD